MIDLPVALRLHTRLGLDTPIFIYHIQASSPFSAAAGQVLDQFTRGTATGVTSVLTLTELLVKPYQSGQRSLAARYEPFERTIPNFAVVDIDAEIARRAALLRARYQLRTPDAIQVATALERGATAFVTNDVRLRRIAELTVTVLADYTNG